MVIRVFNRVVAASALAAASFLVARPVQAAVVTPDHVVVVIMEDRFANAIGDAANMSYTNNTLASGGLIYSNSHGINNSSQEGEMSYLTLYSGYGQGVTDDGANYSFNTPTLAQSLNNAGKSFIGYSAGLPSAGTQTPYVTGAGTVLGTSYTIDDYYSRAFNPMAQFSSVGTGKMVADVSKTFGDFQSLTSGGQYQNLPTVSFVVPDNLDNTHGSNDMDPFATDPSQYSNLRGQADLWLSQNINGYLQWAKTHNSLLIVTGDEGDRANNFDAGTTTIVNGSTNLFVPGVNSQFVNDSNILATIEDMYGLTRLGDPNDLADTADVAGLATNGAGLLVAPEPASAALVGMVGLLLLARRGNKRIAR